MIQLIQERRELRRLLQRLTIAKVTNYQEVERLERDILALVLKGLDVSVYDEPNRGQLPLVVRTVLFKTATTFELLDRPELVFDRLGCGVITDDWSPKVKARLLDLAGPFENVAARLLQEEPANA